MRVVAAPQEFKGTLTAEEAATAIAQGCRRVLPHAKIDVIPMADGGPGTVRAMVAAAGGEIVTASVTGPLATPVDAAWGMLPDGAAVIEMAAAAGLVLIPPDQRDPRVSTTYGVGQLIRAALDAGCSRIIIGLGGSATNDGGAGMAQALGFRLLDSAGNDLGPGGAALARLDRINSSGADPRISEATVLGATDVRNPLCGPEGASVVYGPQKGATSAIATELDAALARYAAVVQRDLGQAVAGVPGAGAAGGLGAGLVAFLHAELRPGVDLIADAVGLRRRITGVDLVVTGEGRLDGQTQYGKTPAGVARIAHAAGVPVLLVAGRLGSGWETMRPLVDGIESAANADGEPGQPPAESLATATERAVRAWLHRRTHTSA